MLESITQLADEMDPHLAERPTFERQVWIESRCRVRIEPGRPIANPGDDLAGLSGQLDLDGATARTIAVDDDVCHPFVDRMDEIDDGRLVGSETRRRIADELTDVLQSFEISVDSKSGGSGHAGVALDPAYAIRA